jgi:(R,R)-butanediol dehydrogenase/meso-butanediol dehydrogenase/diacetyl reductase
MRALQIVGVKSIAVQTRPDPQPAADEVIVQMKAAAICGSDLHPFRHPRPQDFDVIPGHEPCGVIAEVGKDVKDWSVGDRVVVYFRRTCGECHYCRTGHRNVCVNRRSSYGVGANGSDSDYMAVESRSIMRLPDDFDFVDGAVIACQAGTAYYPLTRLQPNGRDYLIVSGLGPVGLLATTFATAMGTHVIGIDPSAERRRFAQELGARETLDPTAAPIADQVRDITPLGADKLIETSGANAAHAVIGQLLKPNSTAAIVGLGSPNFEMPLMSLVHRQVTLFGTSIYPDTLVDEIWDFVRRHRLSLSRVVTDFYSLEEGQAAFDKADSAKAGKVCFRFG